MTKIYALEHTISDDATYSVDKLSMFTSNKDLLDYVCGLLLDDGIDCRVVEVEFAPDSPTEAYKKFKAKL